MPPAPPPLPASQHRAGPLCELQSKQPRSAGPRSSSIVAKPHIPARPRKKSIGGDLVGTGSTMSGGGGRLAWFFGGNIGGWCAEARCWQGWVMGPRSGRCWGGLAMAMSSVVGRVGRHSTSAHGLGGGIGVARLAVQNMGGVVTYPRIGKPTEVGWCPTERVWSHVGQAHRRLLGPQPLARRPTMSKKRIPSGPTLGTHHSAERRFQGCGRVPSQELKNNCFRPDLWEGWTDNRGCSWPKCH